MLIKLGFFSPAKLVSIFCMHKNTLNNLTNNIKITNIPVSQYNLRLYERTHFRQENVI